MLWMKDALFFKDIPNGYHRNEKVMLIGIDFSGIQNFIYQNDSIEKLNQISMRSEYIQLLTVKLNEELANLLGQYSYTSITVVSGKIQAITKTVEEAKILIINYIKKAQEAIFAENEGKIQLFYGITFTRIKDKHFNRYKNAIVSLMNVIDHDKYKCVNLYEIDFDRAKDISYSISTVLNGRKYSNSFKLSEMRLVAVKMDFDNLGNLFSVFQEADLKAKASSSIYRIIKDAVSSMENIHLLYAGGDDIFFICPFNEMIEIIQNMYHYIKSKIFEEDTLSNYAKDFGISCGACVFYREVPMLYFMDNSETELIKSKIRGKNQITIEDMSFSWIEWEVITRIRSKIEKRTSSMDFTFRHLFEATIDKTCDNKDRVFLKQLIERGQ